MFRKILIIALTGTLFKQVAAQNYKPILIQSDTSDEHLSEYYTYWLQPFDQQDDVRVADSMCAQDKFTHWKWDRSLSLGDARKRLWVRIAVLNVASGTNQLVLSINDFMDTATLYMSSDTGFIKLCSDSYWKIASRRLFPTRPLCLPFTIPGGQARVLYLSIAQHNNNLYFPLHIMTAARLLRDEGNFIIREYWFWLVGFYVFSMCFNLILFGFLRDRIYLWYCLYVLFNTVFLLMEDSLDGLILPQWLYTFIWQTGQYSFLLLSATTGIRIMQTFLRQRSTHPVLYKLGTGLMALSYGFVFVVFLAQNYLSPVTRLSVINSIKTIRDILIFVNLGWVLLSLVVKMIQKSRIVYYYAITYAFFFVSCVMFMLNHLGLASINLVEPNILAWGLFFELLTLSVLLTGRFRYVIRQSGQLQVKNIQLEKRQVQQLLEAQEYERKRIAEDLHDDIGATLSALQLHLSNLPADDPVVLPTQKDYVGKALYLAAKAAEDVRNISHDLLPKDFRDLGLFRVLNNRIEELNSIQEIRFDLIVTGEETRLTDVQNITIYRIINELISNVIRHSQAAAATIQVLIHDLEAMLLVEDDGIGIGAAADRKGIGLRNIQSRVSFLAARINIDSNSKGTNIIITIPLT